MNHAVQIRECTQVGEEFLDWMTLLVYKNVGNYYRGVPSMGWSWTQKCRELRQAGMRYLVAASFGGRPLMGFLAFLYTDEPDERGRPRRVAYIYELQVEAAHQGAGIGAVLLRHLEDILKEEEEAPKQMMLTCFAANVGAMRFYRRQGLTVDPISPSNYEGEQDCGYEIMSKNIDQRQGQYSKPGCL